MSHKYKFHDQERPYFVTFSVIRWIDVFTRREYKDILVDSFKYCIEKKGLRLYAWVIMSNHVHLIIGTNGKPMQDILRDVKRHTSKRSPKQLVKICRKAGANGCYGFLSGKGKLIRIMNSISSGSKEIIQSNYGVMKE